MTLDQWLDYQQHLHAQTIALGLDRVRVVWQRLGARRPAPVVITVGGTNGKGSTAMMLEAMLAASGRAVGCYTSPHLHRYNERVRIRGCEAADAALIAVFTRIDQARGDIALTWFEFGTLAALVLFADAALDVAVLEVGLGGRLDAVNIVDADAAIVITVDLDHMDYLGPDRDTIGREKAGIFRRGRPAIIGDASPPHGLLDAAAGIGAEVHLAGHEFALSRCDGAEVWSSGDATVRLPRLALAGRCQIDNAAAALAALHALRETLGWPSERYAASLASVYVPARIERIAMNPDVIVDVAHNPQAARALAAWLRAASPRERTFAVFSALQDKDIGAIAAILGEHMDHWFCCGLGDAGNRGLDAAEVERRVLAGWRVAKCSQHVDPVAALAAARAAATAGDRIVAFGSFHVAGALAKRPAQAVIVPV